MPSPLDGSADIEPIPPIPSRFGGVVDLSRPGLPDLPLLAPAETPSDPVPGTVNGEVVYVIHVTAPVTAAEGTRPVAPGVQDQTLLSPMSTPAGRQSDTDPGKGRFTTISTLRRAGGQVSRTGFSVSRIGTISTLPEALRRRIDPVVATPPAPMPPGRLALEAVVQLQQSARIPDAHDVHELPEGTVLTSESARRFTSLAALMGRRSAQGGRPKPTEGEAYDPPEPGQLAEHERLAMPLHEQLDIPRITNWATTLAQHAREISEQEYPSVEMVPFPAFRMPEGVLPEHYTIDSLEDLRAILQGERFEHTSLRPLVQALRTHIHNVAAEYLPPDGERPKAEHIVVQTATGLNGRLNTRTHILDVDPDKLGVRHLDRGEQRYIFMPEEYCIAAINLLIRTRNAHHDQYQAARAQQESTRQAAYLDMIRDGIPERHVQGLHATIARTANRLLPTAIPDGHFVRQHLQVLAQQYADALLADDDITQNDHTTEESVIHAVTTTIAALYANESPMATAHAVGRRHQILDTVSQSVTDSGMPTISDAQLTHMMAIEHHPISFTHGMARDPKGYPTIVGVIDDTLLVVSGDFCAPMAGCTTNPLRALRDTPQDSPEPQFRVLSAVRLGTDQTISTVHRAIRSWNNREQVQDASGKVTYRTKAYSL